jgi:hypothetical protein
MSRGSGEVGMTKPHSPHTPGPWRVNEDAAGITVVDSEGWIVAEGIGGFENERGTARLIAAAPELYEALETLFAAFEKAAGLYGPCPLPREELVRACEVTTEALAKARGEA